MRWGKPADYLCAMKYTTNVYKARLLEFLEANGYPQLAKLKAEIEKEEKRRDVQPRVGD